MPISEAQLRELAGRAARLQDFQIKQDSAGESTTVTISAGKKVLLTATADGKSRLDDQTAMDLTVLLNNVGELVEQVRELRGEDGP